MEWKVLSKIDAATVTSTWQQMEKEDFDEMVANWSSRLDTEIAEDYKIIRKEVVEAYDKAKHTVRDNEEYRKKKDYFTDLLFAIDFYEILKRNKFSVRMASNDQVWMYMCVKVFPDIVHNRYSGVQVKNESGTVKKHINEERFWKTRRRIYLKVLWWYIYLSMQVTKDGEDDVKATVEILKNNSTDEIVQIVERSGVAGYRVDVYREIMRYYSEHRDKYDNSSFRKVMVLNTAKTKVVEPDLIEGGAKVYVKELFEFVS